MVIFLASALTTLPQLSSYRLKILTALSVRYPENTIEPLIERESSKLKDLVDWFTLALFGRHATVHEVTTWRTRCGIWLAATRKKPEPEPEPLTDGELVQEPESMSIVSGSGA